jgi:glucose-6-phosphate 1-dehydrogenase
MRSSWGPPAAGELIERDGRRWFEVVTPDVLERTPLFAGAEPLLLNAVIMALHPTSAEAGETLINAGDVAREMFLISRGEVQVLDKDGKTVRELKEGDFFGEVGLLMSVPRTATVRAKTQCDLFVLEKGEFCRILRDHPQLAELMTTVARERYDLTVSSAELMNPAS